MDTFDLTRFSFVASALSTVAVTASEAPTVAQSLPELRRPDPAPAVPFHFDRAAFQAVLDRPFPHRQLAVPASYAEATAAVSEFQRSLAAYSDPNGFAAGPQSLHCAAVLYRGLSVTMVLDDAMYARYPIGLMNDEEMRPSDVRYRAAWTAMRRNPMTEFLGEASDHGVSFFVCNNRLSDLAAGIAKRINAMDVPVTLEQVRLVHDELAQHFVPSTMLVPAGVAAIIAAQEARFTYLP